MWATFWAQLGTSLIVAVGLALLWDLVGKRAFAREILETARIAADVETAGLLGAGTKIYEADWERYFTTVRELDIFFAYGNTWRGLNQTRLSRLAAQPHARIRVFLPDPNQTSVIEQLASRFSKEAAQVGTLIEEAHRDFAQLATNARADVSIHYWPGDMLFTMYRFDSTIRRSIIPRRRIASRWCRWPRRATATSTCSTTSTRAASCAPTAWRCAAASGRSCATGRTSRRCRSRSASRARSPPTGERSSVAGRRRTTAAPPGSTTST